MSAEYKDVTLSSDSTVKVRSERLAELKVRCLSHSNAQDEPILTTYDNYLRSKKGLPCCGRQSVSEKLANRVFSEETRKKMSEAMTRIQATKPRSENNRDSY